MDSRRYESMDGRGRAASGTAAEGRVWNGSRAATKGTPQGAALSPLSANIYLHRLDAQMRQHGYRTVRYADGFMVLCTNEAEVREALGIVRDWMATSKLTLHPQKTRTVEQGHLGVASKQRAHLVGPCARLHRCAKRQIVRLCSALCALPANESPAKSAQVVLTRRLTAAIAAHLGQATTSRGKRGSQFDGISIVARRVIRGTGTVLHDDCPSRSLSPTMLTHPTGAPYAALSTAELVNPRVRFGAWGGFRPSRPLSTS